jgi:hypothetical protein
MPVNRATFFALVAALGNLTACGGTTSVADGGASEAGTEPDPGVDAGGSNDAAAGSQDAAPDASGCSIGFVPSADGGCVVLE